MTDRAVTDGYTALITSVGVIAAWNEGPGKEKKTVDCARKMGGEMIRTYGI
jgi:hypothetical protein